MNECDAEEGGGCVELLLMAKNKQMKRDVEERLIGEREVLLMLAVSGERQNVVLKRAVGALSWSTNDCNALERV